MGRKISLVALSAVLSFSTLSTAIAQETGTFYVELVGPDEVIGEPEQQTYGPVRSNDTLWAIASLNRPSRSISVYQMMFAILNKNPQAFNSGNINSIINGSYLTLPTLQEAQAINHQAAVQALAPKKTTQVVVNKPVAQTTTTQVAPAAATPKAVTPARPMADAGALEKTQKDLDSLRDRLETRIDELEQLKRQEFDVLKQQMDESSQQMVGLAEVNHRMKMRIQELSDELASIREELNENRRNQTQILQLLEKPKIEASEMDKESSSSFFSSPLNIGLAIFIPILLIALVITLLFRRKAKKELEEQDKEMAESTLNMMDDENDEFSQLFSDNLEPEDGQTEDLNSQFEEDEPDLSVDETIPEPESFEDDVDDLEPEIEEASFEDFAATQEEADSSNEISLDDSEMAALDAFESDDLVPSLDDAPEDDVAVEEDSDSVISAHDLAAALAMDDDEQDLFEVSEEGPAEDEELSFEDALKQQQEMEAELSEVSEQEKVDLDNIDLSAELDEDELTELEDPTASLEDEFASLEEEAGTLEDATADLEALSVAEETVETPELETAPSSEPEAFDLDDDFVDLTEFELEDPSIEAEEEAAADNVADISDFDSKLADLDLEPLAEETSPELATDAVEETEDEVSDGDIDSMFASFGSDAFNEDAEATEQEELPSRSDIEEREFVDIDMLLNDADEENTEEADPYDSPSLDVELDSFPDVLPQEQPAVDVDANAEMASKLDLARAYLEIDDQDGAKKILQEVLISEDKNLKKEAEELLSRFS
ncbi:FimV/HubP family polar landmark protein [Agarivorans aestuarii]|uniref:FimV/HubP family polar landmark protein n=1 Tax=Agarivorans aestuarii TaxID=1563703 RepID=A0ABU7G0U2_9ALTE|nr:FimV/HubP family polar landmark protein [Agarivorans aestuarii]MEE1672945.1 FimV/HubP family polar landmark protein [Agarivorans aestuarii]